MQEMMWMKQRLNDRMNALNFNSSAQQLWNKRCNFVTVSVNQTDSFVPQLLSNWTQSVSMILLEKFSTSFRRLDARYDWLPMIDRTIANESLPISFLGTGCDGLSKNNVSGKLALIDRSGNCSFYVKVKTAQKYGAIGAVVFTTADLPIVDMNCVDDECNDGSLSIPATMIDFETGQSILNQQQTTTIRFFAEFVPGFYFIISSDSTLSEMGWLKYPSLQYFAWQSQWENYMARLEKRVGDEREPVEFIIFDQVSLVGQDHHSATSSLLLPDIEFMQIYQNAEIDMSLTCGPPGTPDSECPIWDYVLQLYVVDQSENQFELGRWITPFRRGIGRWTTNIRPLLPLLTIMNNGQTKFLIDVGGTPTPWVVTAILRFSNPVAFSLAPSRLVNLFQGSITFNSTFNNDFQPISFELNPGEERVQLFAVITGHGNDPNNGPGCCEFYPTEHVFTLNNNNATSNSLYFSEAGTPTGCADTVNQGTIPNEHGTWLYGRGGWCDGRNVFPWVVDITSQVLNGTTNTISYKGLVNGANPVGTNAPGTIAVWSYLSFWSQSQGKV